MTRKEERINEIEHRTFKITQAEEQEEKRMRKNAERLRDLWRHHHVKQHKHNESPRRKEKRRQRAYLKVIAVNSPNLRRETDIKFRRLKNS